MNREEGVTAMAAGFAGNHGAELAAFIMPDHLLSRQEVLARPSTVPAKPGVYGWWFREPPPLVDCRSCRQMRGLTLLYVGISPDKPKNGRPASAENLRKRLEYHYTGNAEGSTLRKTLGCLLSDELGIQLRRMGSGRRTTFAEGEQTLSAWMAQNAHVSWVVQESPWELEERLIRDLDVPLNLMGNKHNQFHPLLTRLRAQCVAQARALPVLPNPGIGGR